MPDWTPELQQRLAQLRLSPAREAEIIEELSQHLDDRIAELERDGTSAEAAIRVAVAELRDDDLLERGLAPLRQSHAREPLTPGAPRRRLAGDLWQDLRYATRLLVRQPAFTLAAVITLALGIGANTAIFSLVDATLFQRLPVRDIDSIATVGNGRATGVFSYPVYAELRDHNEVSDGLIAWGGITASLNADGETDLVTGAIVTGNFFELLGVGAARGRAIATTDDVTPMAHPVAMVSHGLWQRRFGGRPDIIGHKILLNGQPFTIIGIPPRDFPGAQVGVARDLYVPMMMQPLMRPPRAGYSGDMNPDLLGNRNNAWLFVAGRLKPGVTRESAHVSFTALANRLAQAQQPPPPPGAPPRTMVVTALAAGDPMQREQLASVAGLLLGVVGAVLLIACANVANLLLSRALSRRREIALRLAMGASRWRLVRQLLTESVLLALIGGVLGAGLAWAVVGAFRAAPPPAGLLPVAVSFSVDGRVLVFALTLSVVTGVMFGLLPALSASRPGLVPALKAGADDAALSTGRRRRLGLKRSLVVIQVALSLALLVTAGLFIRSLTVAQAIDPGFDVDRLISAPLNVNLLRYTREQGRAFYARAVEAATALPGAEAAAVARVAVVTGGGRVMSMRVEGRQGSDNRFTSEGGGRPAADNESVMANVVSGGFFKTLGIELMRGRSFEATDVDQSPRVTVVNETLAKTFFPGEDPIGRRLDFTGGRGPWVEIVGVVGDSTYATIGEEPPSVVYLPLSQNHETGVVLYVRARGNPAALAGSVRQAIQTLEPNLPMPDITPVSRTIGQSLYGPRMGAILLGGFGLLALTLAAVGLYGVLAFSIAQRAREFGVRQALGASTRDLFTLVLREGMLLAGMGTIVGLAAAIYGRRWLSSFLFSVGGGDWTTFVAGPIVLALVALLACLVPARRATKVDPVVALRG